MRLAAISGVLLTLPLHTWQGPSQHAPRLPCASTIEVGSLQTLVVRTRFLRANRAIR